jgi:diacylglycerol kinase (ATP)
VSRLSIAFIAHPGAGRGAFARRWPDVAAALARSGLEHDVVLTSRPWEAAELARHAADDGVPLIVAVGGDGTLHEVVNGLLGGRDRLPDATCVGLVPTGRGSDYARGLGLPTDPDALVARFRAALDGDPDATHPVDVGEVHYARARLVAGRPLDGPDGEATSRRYINNAGVGFSTVITQRTARFPPRLGAYLYTVAGLVTIIDWRERVAALTWDDGTREERRIESVEAALGQFEGGGMWVAPEADPGDGLFDIAVFESMGRAELLTFSWRIRTADHLRSPHAWIRQSRSLAVEVADGGGPLYLQADGELLGRDPVRFELLPGAIRFVW